MLRVTIKSILTALTTCIILPIISCPIMGRKTNNLVLISMWIIGSSPIILPNFLSFGNIILVYAIGTHWSWWWNRNKRPFNCCFTASTGNSNCEGRSATFKRESQTSKWEISAITKISLEIWYDSLLVFWLLIKSIDKLNTICVFNFMYSLLQQLVKLLNYPLVHPLHHFHRSTHL